MADSLANYAIDEEISGTFEKFLRRLSHAMLLLSPKMPKEQMLLFETKALAETYLPLKNTIDNGVWEALKKSDRARKKERIKTSWAARKRRERILRKKK